MAAGAAESQWLFVEAGFALITGARDVAEEVSADFVKLYNKINDIK